MLIAVYAIAKNEAKHVESFVSSARDADLVVVADTGSTDNTVELLMAAGKNVFVYNVRIDPFRFDHARNASLELVPSAFDICVVLDLDEQLRAGWRPALEEAWAALRGARMTMRPRAVLASVVAADCTFPSIRAHSRWGWKWHYPCHNLLKPTAGEPILGSTPRMVIEHHQDQTKSRRERLWLLRLGTQEYPDEPRPAFYLGREYSYREMWAECSAELRRYLELQAPKPVLERAAAMRWIARAESAMGNRRWALVWALRACAETDTEREPWAELARILMQAGDWEGAYFAARRALSISEKPQHYLTELHAWNGQLEALLQAAAQSIRPFVELDATAEIAVRE